MESIGYDDELKQSALQWLRDGNELEAASVLERCDVLVRGVDLLFDMSSDRTVDSIVIELYASRKDLNLMKGDENKLEEQIQNAIKHFIGTDSYVQGFTLHGKVEQASAPVDPLAAMKLGSVDSDHITHVWEKALERRSRDPEGAITSARTLLETVCKYILDSKAIVYDDKASLPKLYHLTAQQLNLAPGQHTEEVFKQILGGCQAIVGGLGSLRNRLSDAHGRGKTVAKPASRHAELAVNLAGAMATFLVATFEASKS